MKRARSTRPDDCPYVSKGGLKLAFALERFGVDAHGLRAADLGCHKGGFTDCLLQNGAERVYAVDTAYGLLEWKLRNDPRVVVVERTNLLHWATPERVDLIVIDAGWTRQRLCLPAALKSLKPGGHILSLVKPQYESERSQRVRGVLTQDALDGVLENALADAARVVTVLDHALCPVKGSGGNVEAWLYAEAKPEA